MTASIAFLPTSGTLLASSSHCFRLCIYYPSHFDIPHLLTTSLRISLNCASSCRCRRGSAHCGPLGEWSPFGVLLLRQRRRAAAVVVALGRGGRGPQRVLSQRLVGGTAPPSLGPPGAGGFGLRPGGHLARLLDHWCWTIHQCRRARGCRR